MPLSKAKDRERKRLAKLRLENDQSRLESISVIPVKIPNSNLDVRPKLPWYVGASDHFGQVKSKYYAKQFFDSLMDGK